MPKETWKQKMSRVKTLRVDAAGNVFDRVSLLVEIDEDDGFRAEHPDDWEDLLNTEVADVCADYLTLRSALARFPNRRDWTRTRLDVLVAKALTAEKEDRRKDTERRVRRTATVKELEEAKGDAKHHAARAKQVESEASQLRKEVESLRAENRTLREQNAELRGRLTELERFVKPEPAGV